MNPDIQAGKPTESGANDSIVPDELLAGDKQAPTGMDHFRERGIHQKNTLSIDDERTEIKKSLPNLRHAQSTLGKNAAEAGELSRQ